MPDRPLTSNWPSLVNSTGTPGTGTRVKKETFDEIHDAIDTAIYDPSLDEGPPEIASEVVTARAEYPSLASRLEALNALAAGGAGSVEAHQGGLNVVPNDSFLIWPTASNTAPAYWAVDAGLTSLLPVTTQGYGLASSIFGRNFVQLQNPDTTPRNFYINLVSSTQLSTYGAARLKGTKVAAGAFLFSATPDAVDVYVFDGVTNHQVGEQGSPTSQWVWSGAGSDPDLNGGCTLGSSAAQLTLRITVKAAATVWVAAPALVWAADSLTSWPGPCPTRRGQWVWSLADDGTISTGNKVLFYPPNPIFVYESRLRLTTGSGANTFQIYKDGGVVMTPAVTGGSTDSGVKNPTTIYNASFGTANRLLIYCSAADASARGPNVSIRYFEYLPPLEAAFGGDVAIPVS